MTQERLQKLLARAGVASRRASEDLIRQGRVSINGEKADIGAKADPAADVIRVDGEIITLEDVKPVYIVLNKPRGVVSAVSAQRQENRQTVIDLVPVAERLYPVGRLDADSEGLILLTNDGDLTLRLTHPRYGHTKTYRVLLKGHPKQEVLDQWAAGVDLEDGRTAPCQVRVHQPQDNATWIEIEMGEGRKRQIRRTAAALHLYVERLIRTQIGPLKLTGMKAGEWRHLEPEEVHALKHNIKREKGGPRHYGKPRRRPSRRQATGDKGTSSPGRASQKRTSRTRSGPGGKTGPGGKAGSGKSRQSRPDKPRKGSSRK